MIAVSEARLAWLAAALACLALAARTPGIPAVVVTAAAGVAGILAPAGAAREPAGARRWIAATVVGVAAFAVARMLSGDLPAPAVSAWSSTLAAVAEEALFRRLLYGRLMRFGAAAAVGVSALAFALVHVPAYGFAVVPVDLGAGLLLGWQRWASGTWTAPAVSHVFANLV